MRTTFVYIREVIWYRSRRTLKKTVQFLPTDNFFLKMDLNLIISQLDAGELGAEEQARLAGFFRQAGTFC